MTCNVPRCMSSWLDIWFQLELVRRAWKLSNSGENVTVGFKDVLRHQWHALKLLLGEQSLVGMRWFLLCTSFITTMMRQIHMHLGVVRVDCRLCGCHLGVFLESTGIACCFHRIARL